MNVRQLTLALGELSLGLLAATATLVLLKRLVELGSLPAVGWLMMAACGAAVVFLGLRTVMWLDPDARRYFAAIRGSELAIDPRKFISSAARLAEGFQTELRARGVQIDGTANTLNVLTDFLAMNGEMVSKNPRFQEGATAYYGEILRAALKGEWRLGRPILFGGRRDVLVQVGRGRYRHDISPGMHVYLVASGSGLALQEVVKHELTESDDV
jgi:hypothetical protein